MGPYRTTQATSTENLRRRTPRGKYGDFEEGSWSPAWVSDRYPPPAASRACVCCVPAHSISSRRGSLTTTLCALHLRSYAATTLSGLPIGIPHSHYPVSSPSCRTGRRPCTFRAQTVGRQRFTIAMRHACGYTVVKRGDVGGGHPEREGVKS